jgi:chaperonin GroES
MGRLVDPPKKDKPTQTLNGVVEAARKSKHPLARCKPRGDRVVVVRDAARKQTEGGILLPESFDRTKMPVGTIISIGPGRINSKGARVPMDLKVGDRVLMTNYAGMEIRDGRQTRAEDEFVMLREEDVLATLPAE